MRFVVDNQVLYRALIAAAAEGVVDEAKEQARAFLEQVEATDNAFVVLPPPVVTEFLTLLPAEQHQAKLDMLLELADLPPLTSACALQAATLSALVFSGEGKSARDAAGVGRQCAKFDALILGTAEAQRVEFVVSLDDHMRTLSLRAGLKVRVVTPQEAMAELAKG